MKRILPLLLAILLLLALPVSAVGGSQQDPVVALSYLDAIFAPALQKEVNATVSRQMNLSYNAQFAALTESIARWNRQAVEADTAPHNLEGVLLLRQGDVITLSPGCQAVLHSGSAKTNSANLINVTDGVAVANNAVLTAGKLYMKNHLPTGGLTVTSETAEIYFSGVAARAPGSAVDYGSLADALKAMGLFRGTSKTSYSLQKTATRAEGLVMFLRLLGLEDEALAYTGSCPFTDMRRSDWCYSYVAYAYSKGLTTGTSKTTFSPNDAITAQQYITFLMRAMGFAEGTAFTYKTVLQDCVRQGLFNAKEISTMSGGAFLRCKMVYLSYYSLFSAIPDTGRMLASSLVGDGVMTVDALRGGICKAASVRLS